MIRFNGWVLVSILIVFAVGFKPQFVIQNQNVLIYVPLQIFTAFQIRFSDSIACLAFLLVVM